MENKLKQCTTMQGGKNTTTFGKAWTAHSDDSELSDASITYIPQQDHEPNSKRNVYLYAVYDNNSEAYKSYLTPRLNVEDRGADNDYGSKYARNIVLGKIPQVAHTFGYLAGNYGIINEKGVSFGECTNGTKFSRGPTDKADDSGPVRRLFYTSELTNVACERASSAKEACMIMAELVETYGYYGTGETIPVADEHEAWIMDFMPSRYGNGGYWVAQKLKDNEVFIGANESRFRKLTKGDHRGGTLLVCDQVFKDFKVNSIDWLYSLSEGEYNHPYYSLRRVWRAFDLIAPSLKLSPWVKNSLTQDYPFAVVPDHKLSLQDIERIYRDHYEGTQFDLTKSEIDPWGNPNRYNTANFDNGGDVGKQKIQGYWERSISWYYTGVAYISYKNSARPEGAKAISYVALNVPGESYFAPLIVDELPDSYKKISSMEVDFDKTWWVCNRVAEEVYKKYAFMLPDLNQAISNVESLASVTVNNLTEGTYKADMTKLLADMHEFWYNFWLQLIRDYNQGFKKGQYYTDSIALGYPSEWLLNSEWYKENPDSYKDPNEHIIGKLGTFEDRKDKILALFADYNKYVTDLISGTKSFVQLQDAKTKFFCKNKELRCILNCNNVFEPYGKL